MLPRLLMLSLLVGIVEVNAAPFEKGNRQEEMVTRCIIEVLSNALSKPNAPPIDPECKEILKKSSRHNQDEEGDDQQQYETRTKKEPGALNNQQRDSKEEEKQSSDLATEEYEEKRHHAEPENREKKEEEIGKETEQFDEKEDGTGHSKERAFVEGEDDDNDEERGEHKDHYKQEDSKKLGKYHGDSEESVHDLLDKRVHHTPKHADDFPGDNEEDEAKDLEEIIKRHPLSQTWKEPLQLDKFHPIHSSKVPEENNEWEEEKEKRNYKSNLNDLRQKLFGYEEKRSHDEPPRNDLTDEKTFFSKGQKSHFGDFSLENHLINNNFDKRFHYDKEISEEEREKKHHHQDSEEETEHHDSSEESNEKELIGHHFEDKRQHEERKRWPSHQNSRLNYEESNEDSEESEERIDKRHKQEKENFYRKLKHHLQESDEDEPFKQEKKHDEKRYYIGEEMVDGIKRYYPKMSQEKNMKPYEEKKNHQYREDSEESDFPDHEMYKQNYAEEKRSSNKHGLSNDPPKWQSRYFDNADNIEEDRKRSLPVKNIFPDYMDYDLWGKRPYLEDMNHQYGENRSPAKTHKYEEKREHDRMDELAQLLNYKKKSVEFPDFYDSEEIKKRHYDERGRFRERPLTEEEERELENLAIMDLELQKIAEKLSNNRQG